MPTVPCTRCGINQAPAPYFIDEDPLCDNCVKQIIENAKQGELPEETESYNPTHYDYYLAMTNAHDLRHPDRPAPSNLPAPNTPLYEFNNDEGGCPGWNDSCGNMLPEGDDLCPDCTMGRLDAQSPRIPK